MDFHVYLCVLFILATGNLFKISSGTVYQERPRQKSWADADLDCRAHQGRLLLLDTNSRITEFLENYRMIPGKALWTAAYRKPSSWIWIDGCFAMPTLPSPTVVIEANDAHLCAVNCKKGSFAGLQENYCFCLDDIKDLVPLDSRFCDIPCTGNPGESCGGKDAVSLYSVGGVSGFKDDSHQDWKNCVYILKHQKATWLATDCRKKLPFLCKIFKKDGSIMEYKSPQNEALPWKDAREYCQSEGGTLADLRARDAEAVSALPKQSEYWVGLYRNTSWEWHTANTDEHPTWCLTVTQDKIGKLHFETEICSSPQAYVCQSFQSAQKPLPITHNGKLTAFVATGVCVWVLAIITVIVVVYVTKRRNKSKDDDDSASGITNNYVELDDDKLTCRPSCSRSCESQITACGATGSEAGCTRPESGLYDSLDGEEEHVYSKCGPPQKVSCVVEMNKTGACHGGSSGPSSGMNKSGLPVKENEYASPWDMMKRRNDFASCDDMHMSNSTCSSTKTSDGNDYIFTHSKLFPPKEHREYEEAAKKKELRRKRSNSC